ncbi:MAG: hypothetical protein ACLSEC_00745 [Alistipes communis]|uniref:hypothetical protein n=1 Tax=Alistipes communis TaxID=2585118 RepID=UPI001141E64A|nr:hypothetical protein [Alistipes communis]
MRKIKDLTFFSSALFEQRAKGKNLPFEPRQTPSAKIGHVGFYFAKKGSKIEDGFTDILGFQLWNLVFGRSVILLGFNNTRNTHNFCSQKKNGRSCFAMAQPSLFFPYFDFTLYEYGDKVKLMISWKSVVPKPQI